MRGAVIECSVIGGLLLSAIACTLSSLSTQPYDLVEIRFCPVSANGLETKEQKNLDKLYCSVSRYVLKEAWNSRGRYSSQIPDRQDVKFKREQPSDNQYQHISLSGTAICLAGISIVIAARNSNLQKRHFAWLEELKTHGYLLWLQEKSQRDLMTVRQGLNTNFKSDIYEALDNQNRVEAGLISTLRLDKQQKQQDELQDRAYQMQLSTIEKQTEENLKDAAKARNERLKLDSKNSSSSSSNDPKKELVERLQQHENGWLYEICTGLKPLYIIGDQGSFKSYTAAAIALVRNYIEDCKLVSIVDPHLHQNRTKAWEVLINLEPELYGANQNWQEVNEGIQAALLRWNHRTLDDKPITSIFDELTNYSLHEECQESSAELNRRVLSDPRKSNEGVILISHGFTNEATGGAKGFAKSRQSGTLQLELKSDNKMRPLFKGILNGYKDSDGNLIEDMAITLPAWFKPEIIYNWLWKGVIAE